MSTRCGVRGFLSAAKGRREQYYATVAKGRGVLLYVLDREPSQLDILGLIAYVLGRDGTFLSYVSDHAGATRALDAQTWRQVLEAGAGSIMGDYLIEQQKTGVTVDQS